MLSIISIHFYPGILKRSTAFYNVISTLNITLPFIIFMFIGLSFYQIFSKTWSVKKFGITLQILLVNFIILITSGILGGESVSIYPVSCGIGLIIFSNVYIIRDKLKYNRIINFFAEISYSLYVIHGVISYIVMSVLERLGFNPYLAIAIAVTVSTVLAYALNRAVERPTIKLGKKLV
jgi:peptidoglycan/LPS O-acetylase OafA/YrhL